MRKVFLLMLALTILITNIVGCSFSFANKVKDEDIHIAEQSDEQSEDDQKQDDNDEPCEIDVVPENNAQNDEVEILDEEEEEEEEQEEEKKEPPTPPKPLPYRLEIDVTNQVVTAYSRDNSGNYTKVHKQMICTTGAAATPTPLGTFKMPGEKSPWGYFTQFDTYARYWNRIRGSILFHSILFDKQDVSTISMGSVNNLGRAVSHGCVRLTVADAKWIYDNCPAGTEVTVLKKKKNSALTNKLKASKPAYSVVKLTIKADSRSVVEGQTLDIALNAIYDNGESRNKTRDAKWKFNDPKIVSIKDGMIIGHREGKTNFTVSYGGQKLSSSIEVLPPPPPEPELFMDLPDDSITLKAGENMTLKLFYRADTDTEKEEVTKKADWKASTKEVVKVEQDGKVSAVAKGSATITAKYKEQKVKIKITVEPIREPELKLKPSEDSVSLKIGDSKNFDLVYIDSADKEHKVTKDEKTNWKSSDKKIVKVNKSGKITAIAEGSATITAKYKDSRSKSHSVKFKVTVQKPEPILEKISLNVGNKYLAVDESTQLTLNAHYDSGKKKDITKDKGVEWEIPSILFLEEGKIYAKAPGEAKIKAVYGEFSTSVDMVIKEKDETKDTDAEEHKEPNNSDTEMTDEETKDENQLKESSDDNQTDQPDEKSIVDTYDDEEQNESNLDGGATE